MSAVMSTLSMISGGRRTHRKLASRKSGQFSDAGEERTRIHHDLNKTQRSASLQTLEAGGGGVVNLDNLEAKMASIEVSLSSPRRRSAGARDVSRELDALRNAVLDKDSLIQSLKKQLSASLSAARLAAAASAPGGGRAAPREECAALSADERRALQERAEAVKADLEARRNNIQELRKRLEKTHVTDNIDTRIQQAELQYQLGREELELLSLGEQARALAQLIDQADSAALQPTLYNMIRECGGQGTLVCAEAREGAWGAAPAARGGLAVDWVGEHCALRLGDRVVEVNGTLVVSCRSREELQRAAAAAAPARLVLLRGRPSPPPAANTFTKNEATSLRAELGALRSAAEDAERAKESLRSDNTRLTHRISYLEEQVAELLSRHNQLQPVSSSDSCITVNKSRKNVTNINISSESSSRPSARSEVQVFQKGPDITAIVAKLPGLDHAEANLPLLRPRSNASGASSRAAASPRASPPPPPQAPPPRGPRSHSSHSLEHRASRMRPSLSHHCIHAALDYSAETDAAIRMIERNQRHMEKQRLKNERLSRSREEYLRSDSDVETKESVSVAGADDRHRGVEKAADRIEESIKKTNWAERKTLSIIEQLKRSQRLRKSKKNGSAEDVRPESEKRRSYDRIDGKVLENAHKSSRRTAKPHSRSAVSTELESECSDFPNGEAHGSPRGECGAQAGPAGRRDGEGECRPTPPRKPLRLSLHKARSAHSLAGGDALSEAGGGKRPVKRTHAAGAGGARATPRPPRRALGGPHAAPAADDLYPEHVQPRLHSHARNWC